MFRPLRPVTGLAAVALGFATLVGSAAVLGPDRDGLPSADQPYAFNEKQQLIRPKDYRTWVFVGCPLTPNDMNDGHAAFPEFHNVYLDRLSYEQYKQTGKFRDGAIIVKELVGVGTKASFSGKGYFQGEYLGVEAMIKSAERFPREPGNWGFFRFTDEEAAAQGRLGSPKEVASAAPTASCTTCHTSGGQDYVFTQHYPVLRAARNAKDNPENN